MKNYDYSFDVEKRLKQKNNFSKATRVRKQRTIGPNTLERKLWKILGPTFEYVGDGSFKIGNLKPDFVDKTRKIVVEAYGNYWHRNEPLSKTVRRVTRFEREGWRVVIIWEHEIHDQRKLQGKLALL
jgi:G:T-mismatch repair DNA endonuclease (very short patch repair protein)